MQLTKENATNFIVRDFIVDAVQCSYGEDRRYHRTYNIYTNTCTCVQGDSEKIIYLTQAAFPY